MDAIYSALPIMYIATFLLVNSLIPPSRWSISYQATHNFKLSLLFIFVILLYEIHVYISSWGLLSFLSQIYPTNQSTVSLVSMVISFAIMNRHNNNILNLILFHHFYVLLRDFNKFDPSTKLTFEKWIIAYNCITFVSNFMSIIKYLL